MSAIGADLLWLSGMLGIIAAMVLVLLAGMWICKRVERTIDRLGAMKRARHRRLPEPIVRVPLWEEAITYSRRPIR
jgi:hypothetical protein